MDLRTERFEEIVAEALDALPAWVRERMENVDVLIAGPTLRKRLHVAQGDFSSEVTDPKSGASIRTARVSAK